MDFFNFLITMRLLRCPCCRDQSPRRARLRQAAPGFEPGEAPTLLVMKCRTFFVFALAATAVGGARGETLARPSSGAESSQLERLLGDIKHPAPWLNWGGDLRVRNEYFDNGLTLNPHNPLHEQDYFRIRGRVWASLTPVEDLSLNVRLANETREWLKPAGYTVYAGHSGLDLRDGIFDNLNLQWRNVLGQPATLTVGRQDIILGDGWLLGDGTPFDGSWTYFLDAARLTYDFKDQHTTVDVIGILQDARDNGWLETINADQNLPESEQNEKGAILWVANKSLKPANLDGYFIYKQDRAANGIAQKFHPENADIYTLGARIGGQAGTNWKYSVEAAYQFGDRQDLSIRYPAVSRDYRNLSAFGLTSKLAYLFKDPLNNQLAFSYEFLSGDDPSSKTDEAFDNLWGRYPRWSELGLYSYAAETRIGNEANLHRFGPTWSFSPLKRMDFSASYFALFADQSVATRGSSTLFTQSGNFRGHFVQAILKYKLSQHLSAHLWSEVQFPGDYYVYRQAWSFLRGEVMLTF